MHKKVSSSVELLLAYEKLSRIAFSAKSSALLKVFQFSVTCSSDKFTTETCVDTDNLSLDRHNFVKPLLPRKYFSSTVETFFQFKRTSAYRTLCFIPRFHSVFSCQPRGTPLRLFLKVYEKITMKLFNDCFERAIFMLFRTRRAFSLLMDFNFTLFSHCFLNKKTSSAEIFSNISI